MTAKSGHALRDAAISDDEARFAAAARNLGAGWTARLRAAVPEPADRWRVMADELLGGGWLAADLHERFLATDPAPEAGWVLAAEALAWTRARQQERRLEAYMLNPMAYAIEHLLRRRGDRVETPWLWLEACAAVDNRSVREGLLERGATRLGLRATSALLFYIETSSTPAAYAKVLALTGALTPERALEWLGDPKLYQVAAAALEPHVAAHQAALGALLSSHTGARRDAIVKLLRRVDPTVTLGERKGARGEDSLLQTLAANPTDRDAIRVWADLASERGEPGGAVAALMLAIDEAEPEDQSALSAKLAQLSEKQWPSLWNRPGGYPFRERFRGRCYIRFSGSRQLTCKSETWAQRLTSLMPEIADRPHPKKARSPLGDTESSYQFRLLDPRTRTLLPYQEGAHYAGGGALTSSLRFTPSSRGGRVIVDLALPFETPEAPACRALIDHLASQLGKSLFRSGFFQCTPLASGKGMAQRKMRLAKKE